VPRSIHAGWDPAADRDPLATLAAQDGSRIAELVPVRYGRMLTSPFAFFRGGAAVMAGDLASRSDTGLRVQLCGDAHLSNFGVAIAAYLGAGRNFEGALGEFAERYAEQNERDFAALTAAARRGRIEVAAGL